MAGALFTINTVMVGFGQGLLVRSLTGRVRNRVLLVANVAFGVSYVVLLGATRPRLVVATVLVLGGSAVYTLGELLGGPVLAALAAEAAPDHLRGRYLVAGTRWRGRSPARRHRSPSRRCCRRARRRRG